VHTGIENWIAFTNRYPPLFMKQDSGSTSDLFFSYEAGLAHVVSLCSYCPSEEGSNQYEWLKQDLAAVNKVRTPWLVAFWHTPWYTSSSDHTMAEGMAMRGNLEELFHRYGLDFAFNGHVHAYERTNPVYKNATEHCGGTVHITIGDGGNHEGLNPAEWVVPGRPAPPLYDQPEWSQYRELAFGYGRLRLHNASHAEWQWFKNDFGNDVVSDSSWTVHCDKNVIV